MDDQLKEDDRIVRSHGGVFYNFTVVMDNGPRRKRKGT